MVIDVTITATPVEVTLQPEEGPEIVVTAGAAPLIELGSLGPQGPIGPAGPAGSPAYVHTQASASDTWTIPHNLGFRPNVQVTTVGGLVMLADVLHLSDNTLVISFLTPSAGVARLN